MDNGTLIFIVSLAGGIIGICFLIIGFFMSRLVGDVRHAIEETGRNKGRIELIDQQQKNDIKRMEEMTQLEIRGLASEVSKLTQQVSDLVHLWLKNGIK